MATTLNEAGTHYAAEAAFGPVRVSSTAITDQHMAAYNEHMAPFHAKQSAAGGAR